MPIDASPHPAPEQLRAFRDGLVADAAARQLESHIVGCGECLSRLDVLLEDELVRRCRRVGPAIDKVTPAPSEAESVVDSSADASSAAAEVPADLAGHPRYEILGTLGSGGMGAVYKARHRLMDRVVALKVVGAKLIDSPRAVERFQREVRAAAQLAHANIVIAYDAEQAGGTHFLVMECVAGASLARHVEEHGPLAIHEACIAVRQAALGLQHAFEKGMVHRDIKPHNLMRTPDGSVKILDFGLARFVSETCAADGLTQEGMVVGTPDYLAPEQARDSHGADIRADIYSLGCTLYYLLTGRAPFAGTSVVDKLTAHAQSMPRPVHELRPGMPPELSRIVTRMLAKRPEERYQTPAEVAEALVPYLQPVSAPPRKRRHRAWLVAACALPVLAGLVAAAIVLFWQTPHGTVRIESDDPAVEIVFDKTGPTIKGADKEPITLRAGAHGVLVKRGEFFFETDRFLIERGKSTVLKIELLPGKMQLVQDSKVLEARPLPLPRQFTSSLGMQEDVGETIKVHLEQAQTALDKREFAQAVSAATEALRLDEKCTKAYWTRMRANSAQGKLDDVIADCGRLIELNPKEVEAYISQSWAYLNKHLYPECIAAANKALELGTQSESAARSYTNRGCALAHLGHYELALADYDEAVRLTPSPWNIFWRGLVHARTGDNARAKADWDKAVERDATLREALREGRYQINPPPDLSPAGEPVGEIRRIQGTRPINAVALSPNARLALSGDDDNACILWDISSGKPLYRFPGHHENVMTVAFSADGRLALSAGSRTVKPDGTWGPGSDFDIRVWDVARRKEVKRLKGHTSPVSGAVFAPNGKQVLSCDFAGVAHLWDIDTGRPIKSLRFDNISIWQVAFSPDGSRALLAGVPERTTMLLWDLTTGETHAFKGHSATVRCVAFSPDGARALSGSWDKTMCLWELAAKKKLQTYRHKNIVNGVAFAHGGRWLIAGTGGLADDKTAHVWQAGPDNAVHVYDALTEKQVERFDGHLSLVGTLAVSNDSRHVLTGSRDGTLRWWQLPEPS